MKRTIMTSLLLLVIFAVVVLPLPKTSNLIFNFGFSQSRISDDYTLNGNTQFSNFTFAPRFSLEFPNNWNYSEINYGFVFTPNIDPSGEVAKLSEKERKTVVEMIFYGPSIRVLSGVPIFPDMTSNDLCDKASSLAIESGYAIYHTGPKVLPNISDPACTVQYVSSEGEKRSYPNLMILIMHNGIGYTLEYSASTLDSFSKYMPVMDHLIESFKFLS